MVPNAAAYVGDLAPPAGRAASSRATRGPAPARLSMRERLMQEAMYLQLRALLWAEAEGEEVYDEAASTLGVATAATLSRFPQSASTTRRTSSSSSGEAATVAAALGRVQPLLGRAGRPRRPVVDTSRFRTVVHQVAADAERVLCEPTASSSTGGACAWVGCPASAGSARSAGTSMAGETRARLVVPPASLSPSPTECSICLACFQDGQRLKRVPCPGGHIFHENCAARWFQDHGTCPLCRVDLVAGAATAASNGATAVPRPLAALRRMGSQTHGDDASSRRAVD